MVNCHDKIEALRLLLEYLSTQATVIDILIDEALSLVVYQYPFGHAGRGIIGQADKALMHVDVRAADRHTHHNSGSGVPGITDGLSTCGKHGRVLAHHFVVHYEAASAKDDTLVSAYIEFLLVLADDHADDSAIVIDNQCQRPGFVFHRNLLALIDILGNDFHE